MNRKYLLSFFVVPLLVIMAGSSLAGVNVNLNIGPPPVYTFSEPPELVVIPNTYVYFAPGVDMDIVFYHGFWYRPYNGYWYRGSGYNGPWHHISRTGVPRYIINLPPNYRRSYRDYPRIPYGHVHDNWNRWEREKYWNKRQWKHDQNEWKQDQHKDRREHRQDVREQRHEQQDKRQDMRQDRREDRRQDHRDMKQGRQEHRQEMRQDNRENRQEKRDDRQGSRKEKSDPKLKGKEKKQKED